ncbi:hypothetical protein [uncultured Senegalimassilia sp.]|nr:hypothetical protein [uncultured Senegalimassilia sp.]
MRLRTNGARADVVKGALASTDEIWRKWPVDLFPNNGRELLAAADALVG